MPESKYPYDALILDARLRQALVAIRSLGQRGMRVAALESPQGAEAQDLHTLPAFSSRWCQHAFVVPGYDQGLEPYMHGLYQILTNTEAAVLIVSSDSTLALARQYREDLSRRVHIALASEQALAIAVNKQQTLAVAKHLGLGVPRSIEVKDQSEVEDAVLELGLPLVIKPVESWLWNEQQGIRVVCKVVKTRAEAYQAVEELHRSGGTTLFQPLLTGRRESVNVLYAQGKVHACFTQWAKRTYPQLGGTSVYRQSIVTPQDIGAQAVRLVREIDLEGYAEIEFRRDAAGKPYLMEINPRLSASIELAVRSGIDFPYLLFQWAKGEHIGEAKMYRAGIWMRHLGGDIDATMQSLTRAGRPEVAPLAPTLCAFLAAFLWPAYYDYWYWKDPVPAFKAVAGFLRSNLKLLIQKCIHGRKKARQA